jgi:hypothetical protein
MTEIIFYIMDLIVGALDPLYVALTLVGAGACLVFGTVMRRKARMRAGSAGSTWSVRSLMTKDEAKAILPPLTDAAEGMYVFPRLTASTLLQRPRRAGSPSDVAMLDLNDVVFDYAIYTSECELVCVVLVDHGKKATTSDEMRDDLLRSAELPVIKIRPSKMPEPAVLRAHLQLALDQRRVMTRSPKDPKSARAGRLAMA